MERKIYIENNNKYQSKSLDNYDGHEHEINLDTAISLRSSLVIMISDQCK